MEAWLIAVIAVCILIVGFGFGYFVLDCVNKCMQHDHETPLHGGQPHRQYLSDYVAESAVRIFRTIQRDGRQRAQDGTSVIRRPPNSPFLTGTSVAAQERPNAGIEMNNLGGNHNTVRHYDNRISPAVVHDNRLRAMSYPPAVVHDNRLRAMTYPPGFLYQCAAYIPYTAAASNMPSLALNSATSSYLGHARPPHPSPSPPVPTAPANARLPSPHPSSGASHSNPPDHSVDSKRS